MTKEEIKAFKPIINSMKLIREYCETQSTCITCTFAEASNRTGGVCPLNYPEYWFCEAAIGALEEKEDGNE